MRADPRALAVCFCLVCFGSASAEPAPQPAPSDAELLEFLASFETQTGQWPELKEALAKPPAGARPAPRPPKEDAQQ